MTEVEEDKEASENFKETDFTTLFLTTGQELDEKVDTISVGQSQL